MKRISKEKESRILKFLNKKLTQKEIMKKLDVGRNTIRRVVKRNPNPKKDKKGKYIIKIPKRKCIICGKEFELTNPRKIYCSDKCNAIACRIRHPEKSIRNARTYREKHPEKIKQYSKMYSDSGRAKVTSKRWRSKNPERAKEVWNNYAKKHPDRIERKWRNYRKTEVGKVSHRISAKRRKLMLKGIKEAFKTKEWMEKRKATKSICPLCKRKIGIKNLEKDHVYPISKAYKDFKRTGKKVVYTIDDVQPLCRECNQRKSDKVLK